MIAWVTCGQALCGSVLARSWEVLKETSPWISMWRATLGSTIFSLMMSGFSFSFNKGCQLLIYPGAFNLTTGPAHWELLQRGRWEQSKSLSPSSRGSFSRWNWSALKFPVTVCIGIGAAGPLGYWSCTIAQALHGTPKWFCSQGEKRGRLMLHCCQCLCSYALSRTFPPWPFKHPSHTDF